MKIFLSYASEYRAAAEPIAFSLRDRGFEVFLDRDDLPPGRSFDEQIEMAVARADLFVFLISPEAVDPGRFTLTEVEFARRRWRKAGGYVLPVMIAETQLASIPSFLKSVNILQPVGNAAAEISSAVAAMARPPPAARIVPLAIAIGLVTGLLTTFLPLPLDAIPGEPVSAGYVIHYPVAAPLGAPVFFGIGLAGLVAYFERPSFARLLAILLGVFIGWLLAINLYLILADIDVPSDDSEGLRKVTTIAGVAIGAVSGAVGAASTWAGAALATRRLGRIDVLLSVIVTGTVFGCLVFVSHRGDIDKLQSWILFCGWQAAVAAVLGWYLSRIPR
ncbi:MAG: toll/interleukin-1 receptor domain-containing protein [Bauldia litoralis]